MEVGQHSCAKFVLCLETCVQFPTPAQSLEMGWLGMPEQIRTENLSCINLSVPGVYLLIVRGSGLCLLSPLPHFPPPSSPTSPNPFVFYFSLFSKLWIIQAAGAEGSAGLVIFFIFFLCFA